MTLFAALLLSLTGFAWLVSRTRDGITHWF